MSLLRLRNSNFELKLKDLFLEDTDLSASKPDVFSPKICLLQTCLDLFGGLSSVRHLKQGGHSNRSGRCSHDSKRNVKLFMKTVYLVSTSLCSLFRFRQGKKWSWQLPIHHQYIAQVSCRRLLVIRYSKTQGLVSNCVQTNRLHDLLPVSINYAERNSTGIKEMLCNVRVESSSRQSCKETKYRNLGERLSEFTSEIKNSENMSLSGICLRYGRIALVILWSFSLFFFIADERLASSKNLLIWVFLEGSSVLILLLHPGELAI